MNLKRLVHNEAVTLLRQGTTHEALFEREINSHRPGAPAPEAQDKFMARWRLPELGFRNYWYPVMLSRDLEQRPVKRRLLGEDIVFWRDGGKAHALADRCPHRGASLSGGHVRFPGSGTLSCPYHGWTFDGTGQLRACIQEGPGSVMPGKVRTQAYPVEERLGVVWAWIGEMDPVPVEEDLPVAMTGKGLVHFIHFTKVWKTNWVPLFDNFIDGLHAPYVHRTSPQFLFHKLPYRSADSQPHFSYVDHEGKVLEENGRAMPGRQTAFVQEMEFPGLGTFPRHKWWRLSPPRRRPTHNFVPDYQPGSFLHGLPSYVHTVHEDQYFTQFIIPIDRDHLYNMCAMTGHHTLRSKLWWTIYFQIYRVTHDRMFIGQDHRLLRGTTMGSERLSRWDQDVVHWRRFAVQNARGYRPEPSNGLAAAPEDEGGSEALDGTAASVSVERAAAAPVGAAPREEAPIRSPS